MGLLTISNINRNEGLTSQIFMLQFRKQGEDDTAWRNTPQLSYDQARDKSQGGVLPIKVATPSAWVDGTIETRMATFCAPGAVPVYSDILEVEITTATCT